MAVPSAGAVFPYHWPSIAPLSSDWSNDSPTDVSFGVGVLALIATQTHTDPQRFARRTRQCATYWDFLAFIWLGLLALFMGLANHMFDVHSTSLS